MNKQPRKPGHNVVRIPAKALKNRSTAGDFAVQAAARGARAAIGCPDDPRVQEAMRLMESFLAIEDATARSAILTLAERLVSYDWIRKTQQR